MRKNHHITKPRLDNRIGICFKAKPLNRSREAGKENKGDPGLLLEFVLLLISLSTGKEFFIEILE